MKLVFRSTNFETQEISVEFDNKVTLIFFWEDRRQVETIINIEYGFLVRKDHTKMFERLRDIAACEEV